MYLLSKLYQGRRQKLGLILENKVQKLWFIPNQKLSKRFVIQNWYSKTKIIWSADFDVEKWHLKFETCNSGSLPW